eukprot:GILK01010605.1.p1 GENE.GILK01010605.1~~GILK01010605.1.p1  ORF type:complete len:143 (+),score=14.59 GILK01010605.1:70-498(+)
MSWFQRTISLKAKRRGCHVVTEEILRQVPEISSFHIGICHLFLKHTSASLSVNENADPDVPKDMEDSLNRIVPEDAPYRHTDEGSDDMPAHVKSTIVGVSVSVPISNGRLNLGTWQGLYLNEHRNHAHSRQIVVTIQGQQNS